MIRGAERGDIGGGGSGGAGRDAAPNLGVRKNSGVRGGERE